MKYKCGIKVKDNITGFVGVITAKCKYINGCIQYEITPLQLKDGCPQKEYWLDEQRIEKIKTTKEKKEKLRIEPIRIRHHIRRGGGPEGHPLKKNPPPLAGYEP